MRVEGLSAVSDRAFGISIQAHSPIGGGSAGSEEVGCCPGTSGTQRSSIGELLERVPDSDDLIAGGARVARAVVKVLRAIAETWLDRSDGTPGPHEETA